jgi:hypothetical protein
MTPALLSFAYGVGSFAVYAVVALIILRLPGNVPPVARLSGLALLIHAVATAAGVFAFEALPYWYGASLYGFCFIFYLFGFSAVYKSVSLRILTELARQPDWGISLREVADAHVRPSFAGRAALLVAAGYAEEVGGRFRLTEYGRKMAGRLAVVQRVFGVARSGLYGAADGQEAAMQPPEGGTVSTPPRGLRQSSG